MIEHYRMLDEVRDSLDTGRGVTQPLVRDCERQTNSRSPHKSTVHQINLCREKGRELQVVDRVAILFGHSERSQWHRGTISKWDFSMSNQLTHSTFE